MSLCESKIPEKIKYKDESWWESFFRKDFAEFSSRLAGFMNAREKLLKDFGEDLEKIMADSSKKDLALKIILGGVNNDGVEKGIITKDDIPKNSVAGFYRYIMGIGIADNIFNDLENLTKLINNYKASKDLLKASSGLHLVQVNTVEYGAQPLIKTLQGAQSSIDRIYYAVSFIPKPDPHVYNVSKAEDMIDAFVDVLQHGISLLPLYNPFMFFIQSLASVPKPYLKLMYCEDVLESDTVKNIMKKYGIELIDLLTPDLSEDINKELAIIGHKKDSVGANLLSVRDIMYKITDMLSQGSYGIKAEHELKKYIKNYSVYYEEFLQKILGENIDITQASLRQSFIPLTVKSGTVASWGRQMSYENFITTTSPALFLGLTSIHKNNNLQLAYFSR